MQRGEALLGGQLGEFHFRRIAENSRRYRVAHVHIDTGHLALAVWYAEARQPVTDAALDKAFFLDSVQGRARLGGARQAQHGGGPDGGQSSFEWVHARRSLSFLIIRRSTARAGL